MTGNSHTNKNTPPPWFLLVAGCCEIVPQVRLELTLDGF